MIINKKNWEEHFKGYAIVDGTFSRPTRFWFVLAEEYGSVAQDTLPKIRFVSIATQQPMDDCCFTSEYAHFDQPHIAFQTHPVREAVAVDIRHNVYSFADDGYGEEEPIDCSWLDGRRHAMVRRLKTVNGQIHAIAGDRMLFKRHGLEQWHLDQQTSRPTERHRDGVLSLRFGFNDLAAFSETDMYAVGGDGEVWHFNGQGWRQLPFPSNEPLYTACCGADGLVYISGHGGSLWAGRNNQWQRLAEEWASIPFKDSEWFAGRLWCGNEYGLWFLKDGKLMSILSEQPSDIAACCGRLDISPDGKHMLSMSPVGAALYDGEKWEILFNTLEFA